MNPPAPMSKPETTELRERAVFQWEDPFLLDDELTEDERMVRDTARDFAQDRLMPRILQGNRHETYDRSMFLEMGELGLLGSTIKGYDCAGVNYVSYGLIAREIERVDSAYRSCMSVQSSLVMHPIHAYGTEEQRRKYLPKLARGEWIGSFGLTEPDHGSDAVALATQARRDGDAWIIDGAKKWIGNASFADVTIIWARDVADGHVKGFLVEKGMPGFGTEVITGKTAKRAVWQTEITLTGVRVPEANRLAGANSFKDTAKVLTATRYGVAWEAIGHAAACYEYALAYAKERQSFGKPLAARQLIQHKLARMLADVTGMQLLCLRLSQLLAEGQMTPGMASLAKMNNALKARQVCADARDILGGNGILLANHVARHQADMEAVYTYEGTDTVQALIVGREITGVQAFS